MKKELFLFIFIALVISCAHPSVDRWAAQCSIEAPEIDIPGISLERVAPSTFTFGKTIQGRFLDGAEDSFQVIQTEFWISREPIGFDFFQFVYPGKAYPDNGLSKEDVEKMLDKIYQSTGIPFVIASESMYQAAIYAGAIHPKSSQETILLDSWTDERVPFTLTIDYLCRKTDDLTVKRKPYEREPVEAYRRRRANTFYVCVRGCLSCEEKLYEQLDYRVLIEHSSVNERQVVPIGEQKIEMIPVLGGEMMLGATDEQDLYADNDERSPHLAEVGDFLISKTEVTVGQWESVMGYIPAGNSFANRDQAVVGVSWYDAMEFILKLREMTGLPFRLPEEDEWEYAARGGRKSHRYVFAGGNNSADYVVCTVKDKRPKPAKVASKKPNELGLYDMSGNAWEWVRGAYSPEDDNLAVLRGGSRLSHSSACRVANRQPMDPRNAKDTFGFRLAL